MADGLKSPSFAALNTEGVRQGLIAQVFKEWLPFRVEYMRQQLS